MAELLVVAGDGSEQRVALAASPVTFGRADECDVVLAEQRASRRHCTFRPVDGGWRVVDEGSSNGTFLGGRPVLSARLQPGDELEIGQTVITYVADPASAPAPAERPRRAAVQRPAGWGLLAVPLVLAASAYVGLAAYESSRATARDREYELAARAVVQAADRPAAAAERRARLDAFKAALPAAPAAVAARAVVDEALARDAAPEGAQASRAGAALSDLRGAWPTMIDVQRRARCADLLERYVDDPAAVAEIRALLAQLAQSSGARPEEERERTERDARAALEDGRPGDALDLWNGWLLRAPPLDRPTDRAVARALDEIAVRAEAAAADVVEQARKLVAEGRRDSAREYLDAAAARLRGTGFDLWLLARVPELRDAPAATVELGGGKGADTTKERTSALRALAAAEELARLRHFGDAAARLESALETLTDAGLREAVGTRLGDLREESRVVGALLAQVRADPRPFGPLRLTDGTWSVNGATDDSVQLGKGKDASTRLVSELPPDVLGQLFVRAQWDDADARAAGLLLADVGAHDAYTAVMRRALGTKDDVARLATSEVHARVLGRPLPDGGYVPHPTDPNAIITLDELRAIENAAKIKDYTAQVEKLVVKLEATKQAKSLDAVRGAYQKLENARNHALDLIFDEVKYFYPYQGREKEYTPVQRDVDERVAAVRAAWDDPAHAAPTKDKALEKLLSETEDLFIEIDYLGGETRPLRERVEAITCYLDRDLTVRTWFETPRDLKLLQYNDAAMARNASVACEATDDEREQVRVTNEYRIMFGHRRAVLINDQLTLSARGHSDDMARLGFFAHESPVPGKHSPADRVALAGYRMMGCSENIHMGSGTPLGAHEAWIHSSGHHRNILIPAWVDMGCGRSGRHWTQNFGFSDTSVEDE